MRSRCFWCGELQRKNGSCPTVECCAFSEIPRRNKAKKGAVKPVRARARVSPTSTPEKKRRISRDEGFESPGVLEASPSAPQFAAAEPEEIASCPEPPVKPHHPPEPQQRSGHWLFQKSFDQTFEGRLRQSVQDKSQLLAEIVGEERAISVLASAMGLLARFPKKLLERDCLSKARPSLQVAQMALLTLSWGFAGNQDEHSPFELLSKMGHDCSAQERDEVRSLEVVILGWCSF